MILFVFDIDDTLTQSENQHVEALVGAMHELGITEVNQNWTEYAHVTDSFILQVNYEQNLGGTFDPKIIDSFEQLMLERQNRLEPAKEVPGAANMIAYLNRQDGCAVSFATGSLMQPALLKLRQANIWHHEQLLASSNMHFKREDIVRQAINKARMYYHVDDFTNIISVGDGIWDYQTAKNLKVHFIGVGDRLMSSFQKEDLSLHFENWLDFEHRLPALLSTFS